MESISAQPIFPTDAPSDQSKIVLGADFDEDVFKIRERCGGGYRGFYLGLNCWFNASEGESGGGNGARES